MSQTTRPLVASDRHVVAAGHYLATSAAHDVLAAGGNAVDAGCAAGIALGVLQPDLVNVAGVAPIMIRMAATGEVITIDGLGVWPRALPPRVFMDHHGGTIPAGVERVVVPAAPDAWLTALERFGTMSFRDVAHAAARFARDGFATYPLLLESIEEHRADYARWPSTAAIYLPGGKPPALNDRFVQSDLARTFDTLFAAEASARGSREDGIEAVRTAFYRGEIAHEIVRFIQAEGGYLSAEDMADFRCQVEPAQRITWRDGELYVCGPWCQGPALAMALRQIEQAGLEGLDHNAPDYIHLVVEILNNVFADREYHFGDPAHVDVPLAALLSPDHAARRLEGIDRARARGSMPPPILNGASSGHFPSGDSDPRPEPDTSYVAVVDRDGNAFSATPSDGSWNVPVVPGTGLVPSSRGSQSRPNPDHPAAAAPGRRPRLTPNPAIYMTEDCLMPFGTPGGDVQTQAMLQLLLNRFHFGMSLQEAIDAPRFATYNFPSSFAPFTHHEGLVKLEGRIPADTAKMLEGMGHRVSFWPDFDWRAGGLCAVEGRAGSGLIFGAADPRRPAYAIGG